jgi:hypothetical protein
MRLRGWQEGQTYRRAGIDDARDGAQRDLPGREWAQGWELRMPQRGTSLVIRYRAR